MIPNGFSYSLEEISYFVAVAHFTLFIFDRHSKHVHIFQTKFKNGVRNFIYS